MQDTTAAATSAETGAPAGTAGEEVRTPDARAGEEMAAARPCGRPGARLILPVVAGVSAAALATALAIALARARRAAPAAPGPAFRGPRTPPASTVNVNWGFALFGTNVIAARGLPAGRLRRLLPILAARLRRR